MQPTIREVPLHTGRRLRVVCVGAGASGLLLAYKIKYNFPESDVELQIYEKNKDLGGTWLENRCDTSAVCPSKVFAAHPFKVSRLRMRLSRPHVGVLALFHCRPC